MKIIEAINRIDSLKHNTYTQPEKIAWLSTLDAMAKAHVIDTHEGSENVTFSGYDQNTDLNTVLLIPAPYEEAYIKWLEAQIDYANGEYGKYNNAIESFNTFWNAYKNFYNRTHRPLRNHVRYFGGGRNPGNGSGQAAPPALALLQKQIGDLKNLKTDTKENLVAAINEVLLKGADPEEIQKIVEEYLGENGAGGTVKTVNGVSPDENGNVEVAIPEISVARFDNGDESGVTIYVDTTNADGDVISQSATVYDGKDGGGTVEVDTTLSQSGKAADAKAVGDALANVGNPTDEQVASAVQTYLNEHPEATTTVQDSSVTPNKTTFLKQYRKNLLDLTAGEAGKKLEYNGNFVDDANSWVSGLIPAGKTVYQSSTSIQFCGLYLNGSFVVRFNVYSTTLDLTGRTEEFDAIRLSIGTGGAVVTDTEWMFAEGALPTTFVPYDSAENLVTEISDDSLTKIIEDTANQAANKVVNPVAAGLTEELHDDVMIPYDWTQYELRQIANYNAYTVYVPNNAVVAHDGRAYKISFSGGGGTPNGTLYHGEMATLFHFRPVDGTYTEIGRYKLFSNIASVHEYDLDFEVKAGDIFGINSVVGTEVVNLGNREYSVAYTDDAAVSFTQEELDASANNYCARLFTVYISGARDTAGKAQLAAEDGSMSVLRKADIETAPLKNLLNPKCIYTGVLNDDGTIQGAGNAKWALIKVEPNTAYSYNRRIWKSSNNTYNVAVFYDENMAFLSSVTEDLLPFTPEMGKTVVTPDNCAYVAVTILPYGQGAEYDASDIMQFERGTHNTQYEPYGKYVSAIKGIPLFRYIQKEVQEYDVPVNLVVMGDSISSPGLGKWWTHILNKYSFKSARNIGIGGMHWTHTANTIEDITFDLTQQGGPSSGGDSNVLTNAVNLLIDGVTNQGWTKPDVVFIYCGINDRGMALDEDGLEYGDPESAFEYTDDYSNLAYGDEKLQNLCGAFRFAMEKLYRAFPYVKVVVCTPMYTGNNSNKKVRALNKTIKECASWMGIPVFDLGYESYVYQKFEENGVSEKYLGDSLHPNETGGKLLADLIAHHLIARFGGKEFYDLSE